MIINNNTKDNITNYNNNNKSNYEQYYL